MNREIHLLSFFAEISHISKYVVVGNISSLIHESDLLLGVETYLKKMETILCREYIYEKVDIKYWNDLVRNTENAISELLAISDNRWKTYALLLQYYMDFVGGKCRKPRDLFDVMLVMHLIDYFKLIQRLSLICDQDSWWWYKRGGIVPVPCNCSMRRYRESTSNAIIVEAMAQCKALVAEYPTVKGQAMWLWDKLGSFHSFLNGVKMKKLSKEEAAWIDQVFDVCCSTNNIATFFLGSLHHRQKKMKNPNEFLKNLICGVRNFNSQEKLAAKKLKLIENEVQHVTDRKPQLISTPLLLRDNVRSSTLERASDQLDLVSFDEDVDAIIEKLLVEDTHCITMSILGIPGVGKTSLAKLVYTNHAIVHHFPLRLWVSGSGEIEIMEKILDVEGFPDVNKIPGMVETLFADQRFLIVVDDSCAKGFWEKWSHVFDTLPNNGSRIIFTVRKPEEAPPDSETNIHCRLHLRSDDESWALLMFTLKLNISGDESWALYMDTLKRNISEEMKIEVLKTCGGLPKAIVHLAQLLSRTEVTSEGWSRVVEQRNPDEEPWLQILEHIDKYVPLYLRRYLFYFGLFPKDYRISSRRLINLWVAEGLVSANADGTSVESVAEKYLEELISINMVHVTERKLNGKIKTLCLPEAIRSLWLEKANKANFFKGPCQGMRRVADHVNPDDDIYQDVHNNDSNYLYHCYRNSVSFLSFDSREHQSGQHASNFLKRCISKRCFFSLMVLDLEKVHKPVLPEALSNLTLLKYLGLRSTYVVILPAFINKLLSLQTLDLKRTYIATLPRSIWEMEQLRHLFLDEIFRPILLPPPKESLLGDIQTVWGLFIDERSPVENGLDKLASIKKLGLKSKVSMASRKDAMSAQLAVVKRWIMKLKRLQKLRLKSCDESEEAWDLHLDSLSDHADLSSVYLLGKLKNPQLVSKFPENLIELTLSGSGLVDDPMQALDKLPNLKMLRLYSKSYTGARIVCSSGGFPKLQILKLWLLEHLEAWEIEEGSLPRLEDLEIRRCTKLKMLPDGLENIKTLRKVKLTELPLVFPRVQDVSSEDWIKLVHVLDKCIEEAMPSTATSMTLG